MNEAEEKEARFSFYKGSDNVVAPKDGSAFDWERAASRVREHLGIGRSNALFRGAGAVMGWPAPSVEALSGVFVVDGDRPSAVDPGRKRISAAWVVGLP